MSRISKAEMSRLLSVYFIMGSNNCTKDPLQVLRDALEGGITIFNFVKRGRRFNGRETHLFRKRTTSNL